MPTIWTHADPDALADAAAELFAGAASAAQLVQGRFSVALAGGSTPRALYARLAGPDVRVDWSHVHVFWSDERCVPPGDPDSNYRMAHEALLAHVPLPAGNLHRIRGELDPPQAADEYERELRAFFGDDAPQFDLVLLGLGDDGHTASLFPGSPALHETRRWVVAVEHDGPPPPLVPRVTFTPPVLNAARSVIFLVAGRAKAARLAEVLHGPHQPDVLPAQIVRPSGLLVWMVDEAAAGALQP
jgi:6-phosphogluconolactonase